MKTLTGGKTCKLINESDLMSKRPTSFTAVISGVDEVYCLFPGTVEFIGSYKNDGTVTLLVTNHEIIRYLHLDDIPVIRNSLIETGAFLGKVPKRKNLEIEYCTQWRGESKYPIRLNTRTYYKQNPMDLLNGLYAPPREYAIEDGINRPNDTVELEPEQLLEWGTEAQYEDYLTDLRTEYPGIYPNAD